MRRWNAGKAPDDDPLIPGLFCRSMWERNVARWLEWQRQRDALEAWWYEPMRFEFPPPTAKPFTPDFLVLQAEEPRDYFIEVKGWWKPGDWVKIRRMRKYHPDVEVDVLDGDRYRLLAARCAGLIPMWERDERPGSDPGERPEAPPGARSRVPPHVADALRAQGVTEEQYVESVKRFGRRRH